MDSFYTDYSFCNLENSFSRKDTSRFRILPVPYEATTSYKKGTKYGPKAVLEASLNMELFDNELHLETYKSGIHTLPFVDPSSTDPHSFLRHLSQIINKEQGNDTIIVSIGGEHTISIGIIEALIKHHKDLSVLSIDAHADLRNKYMNNSYSHACTNRRIMEICPVVIAGIRSISKEEIDFMNKSKQNAFWGKDALLNIKKIISLLTDTVYISIDVDILDPSIMPSTGTPEPDGWSWSELSLLVREIVKNKRIVGLDFVELSPFKDNPAPDFSIAKLLYRTMGYISLSKGWLKTYTESKTNS